MLDSLYKTIIDTRIETYDDDILAELLSTNLTETELDMFIERSYAALGEYSYMRLLRLRPLIVHKIKAEKLRLESTSAYVNFKPALMNNTYREYIASLRFDELKDLKRMLQLIKNNDNYEVINKVINIISEAVINYDNNRIVNNENEFKNLSNVKGIPA